MSKYDKLDETFDVTPTEVEVTEKKIEKIKSRQRISREITNTRGVISIRSLRKAGAIDGILELVKRVRCLQAYEVTGTVD